MGCDPAGTQLVDQSQVCAHLSGIQDQDTVVIYDGIQTVAAGRTQVSAREEYEHVDSNTRYVRNCKQGNIGKIRSAGGFLDNLLRIKIDGGGG